MKTNGITRALAKNNIVFPILTLIASFPALSQVNYASIKNSSGLEQDRKFAIALYTIPPVKNFNMDKDFILADDRDLKNNVRLAERNKELIAENLEISFKPTSFTYPENSKSDMGITQYPADQLSLYTMVLKQYARKNGFDTTYAFLSNMGMLSNKKRFFVVNLTTMEIEQTGLVAHGRGQGPSVFDKQYSNETGSKSTSLGRYKITGKYKGTYGEAYKMVGLDSSNKNAYSRNIVLHPMGCIPDMDGAIPACVSEGCPAVSAKFLTSLRRIIDTRKKPVLLWIFDSNLEETIVRDISEKNKPGSKYTDLNKQHTCSIHLNDSPGIQ